MTITRAIRIDAVDEEEAKRKFDRIMKAEQVLIDNGIEPDEASTVLQAIGYVLMDEELYKEEL